MPPVTEESRPTGRRRGRYPQESRRDVAALVIDQSRTIAVVATELDLVEQAVGNWVRRERIDRGEREGDTTEMREEPLKYRHEVQQAAWQRARLAGGGSHLREHWSEWRRGQPVDRSYLDSGVHHLAEARAYRWEFRPATPLRAVTPVRLPS